MALPFLPVFARPGLYRVNTSVVETPSLSGLYTTSDLVETPTSSGLYDFITGSAFTLTLTTAPPSAHMVFAGDDLPDTTHTIAITRTHDGVTETIRGASNLFAAGGAVFDDWEIPTGVDVWYMAQAFDVGGVPLGFTDSVMGLIASDPAKAWISDPSNPAMVVQVDLKDDFVNTQTRVRQVQTYQIGDRVVALLGARGKLQNLNFRVQTETIPDGTLLEQILAQTSVLIRTNPPADVPRLLYVVVPDVNKTGLGSAQDIQYGGGLAVWSGTGQEISPTTLDILVPVVTWQSYIDAFPGATWGDVLAIYTGTWLDAISNPPGV